MTKKTVGRFSFEDGVVTGPAAFMDAEGTAYMREMEAGTSLGFNTMLACAPADADIETLVLVALQTRYAGWKGVQDLLGFLK